MTHSNINPLDKTNLTSDDRKKLVDYEIVDFKDLHVKDHFRYSSNKYKEQGRKLAYGVIHKIDRENKILTVNGYVANNDQPQFPDWDIEVDNKYKKYVFYRKK